MKTLDQQFKALKRQSEKEFPLEGHELRFQRKLERYNRPVIRLTSWLSIAAGLFLIIGLTTSSLPQKPKASQGLTLTYETQIKNQLKQLEVKYQADFAIPLQDIKGQLQALDNSYKTLETKFNDLHQHPLILKAMIDNLQQRLSLLNELDQALQSQNIKDYENTTL